MIRCHEMPNGDIRVSAKGIPRGVMKRTVYIETVRGGDGITEASETYDRVYGWLAGRFDEPADRIRLYSTKEKAIRFIVSGRYPWKAI